MSRPSPILFAILAVLPFAASAAESAKPAAEAFHRVEIRPSQGRPLPYTLEVPESWQVRQVPNVPGIWIGPADAKPPEDPRLIWVRGSEVSLADPESVAANIRANDAASPEWSAPRVEVREVAGVRGLIVQMNSGEGEKARSSLTLKLPLESKAVDFVASASRSDFPQQVPLYERIFLSVRPVPPAK
jgi:hypothetical protein